MTDAPKLLTEAEWRDLTEDCEFYRTRVIFDLLRERGLIAPEPVDPLLIEAREIAAYTRRNFRGYYSACKVADRIAEGEWDDHMLVVCALAALRRRMELEREKRPVLTREMVAKAHAVAGGWFEAGERPTAFLDNLHIALQEQLK